MPYPSLTFAQFIDNATRTELEQLISLLQGYLSVQHNEDGEHTDITGESLTLTGDASLADLTADDATFTGNVSVGTGGAALLGKLFTHEGLLDENSTRDVSVDSTATNWGNGTADLTVEMNLRITTASGLAPALRGLAPSAQHGTVYRVFNVSGSTISVTHESAVATSAAYRIACPGGVDLPVPDGGAFSLMYDATSSRWRVFGVSDREGLWTTFTPTWTNVTVGNGTVVARYTRVGKTIRFYLSLTFGGTTAVTGSAIVSLPATMHASMNDTDYALGVCSFRDSSAGQIYWGRGLVTSSTTIALFDNGATPANVTSTTPFTWATGDTLFVSGEYEEA